MSKHNAFYRAIHSINIAAFMTDIITSDLVTHPKEHVSVKQYRQILNILLHKPALIKSKYVSQKPSAPWMTPDIFKFKRRHRYLESVWRKPSSSLDRSRYKRQCHLCNRQMSKTKSFYYEHMVSNNSATPKKQLWKCINQILLLLYQPMHQSSHCVTLFLVILKTKSTLNIELSYSRHCNSDSPNLHYKLASFEPATTAEVRTIIMSSPSKSCDLDPLPTILLKACVDV